jgi:hypothetical protein
MLRIEVSIDACLGMLKKRIQSIEMGSGPPTNDDDDDSLSLSSAIGAAYRARLPGLGRESELLKEKNSVLEQEVAQLRRQVARYQRALGISTTNAYSTENRGGTSLVGRFVSTARVEEEEDVDVEEKKSF